MPLRRALPALLFAVLACLALACATPHAPLDPSPPFADGEEATYDDVTPTSVEQATTRVERDGDGWSFSYGMGHATGVVHLGADGAAKSAHHEDGEETWDVVYGDAEIETKTSKAGKAQGDPKAARYADTVDAEEKWYALRSLPFAPGFSRRFTCYVPSSNVNMPMTVEVLGAETVTVPAGTFDAWHVKVMLGDARDAWYARDAPHWLVKEAHPAAGTEWRLRAYRASKDAEPVTSTEPPAATPTPPPVNVAFVLASVLVQAPLATLLPFALAYVLRRRLGGSVRTILIGAGTFIASQVVHVPLNLATGLIGGKPPLGDLPLVPLSILAGLSAGLCEELARAAAMRFFLKKARRWQDGALFGVGHGGIESILLAGALPMLGLVNVLLAPHVAAGQSPEVKSQIATYWATVHASQAMWAGIERVGAIAFHIGASILVMRAVARRNPAFVALAIALHTALDGVALAMVLTAAPQALVEAVALALGFATLAIALLVSRRDAPEAPSP